MDSNLGFARITDIKRTNLIGRLTEKVHAEHPVPSLKVRSQYLLFVLCEPRILSGGNTWDKQKRKLVGKWRERLLNSTFRVG